MDTLRELYEEVILDHNRNPRNFRHHPEGANHQAHGDNPLCGDELTLYLIVRDGVIQDIGFDGHGCAISTASASLLTEVVKGKTLAQVDDLYHAVHDMLTGKVDADVTIGKLRVLGGVRAYPMRVKCATLAWHTLQAALKQPGAEVSTE